MNTEIVSAEIHDLAGVFGLLQQNEMPASDLISSRVRLWVAKNKGAVVGCIGLEIYHEDGFLRSLAVEKDFQNQGLATRLIDELFSFAKSQGINKMHLLTITAELYFQKRNFIKLNRSEAPDHIQQNSQFTVLCSSTAVYMAKSMG
ncbi:MAG: arsenic resistance N-acetyltransferase ArsN2 [Saprospiraceae bacterium]